jgi:hypothetical protein
MPSGSGVSLASESCLFSLATLEVTDVSPTTSFALTECENSAAWRWAIISADGVMREGGREPTCAQAKRIAETALRFGAV